MTKNQFLVLMRFPLEWSSWGMYPDELFQSQLSRYAPGHEDGAEHDRNEAFHWWMRQELTGEQLDKLWELSRLEPDPGLAEDMQTYLRARDSS